jgi:hypothetical protein
MVAYYSSRTTGASFIVGSCDGYEAREDNVLYASAVATGRRDLLARD